MKIILYPRFANTYVHYDRVIFKNGERVASQRSRSDWDGAQRAYLEDKRSIAEIKDVLQSPSALYQVRGKKVIIRRPCELTAGQLAQLISEIEK